MQKSKIKQCEQDFFYPVHLVRGKHVNHMTNDPRPIQRVYNISNDQTRIKTLTKNYIEEDLNEKGLNFSTSYFVNAVKSDPIQTFARETIINHSFADGNKNFLIGKNPVFKSDDDISIIDQEDPSSELNYLAKQRAAKRSKKAAELEKKDWKNLKRDLYNLFFDMKKTVKNITSDDPLDFRDISKEQRQRIYDEMKRFLIPKRGKKIKENFISNNLRNDNMRKYMEVRSNDLKKVVYADAIFQEQLTENEDDEVMEKLTERLNGDFVQKFKKNHGKDAVKFLRFLLVKELMMKQERDRVIEKRIEMQLDQEEEDAELQALLKKMKGIKSPKPIAQVIKVPKPRNPEKSEISIVSRKPVPTQGSVMSQSEQRKKDKRRNKKLKKTLASKIREYDLKPDFVKEHMRNLDYEEVIQDALVYAGVRGRKY